MQSGCTCSFWQQNSSKQKRCQRKRWLYHSAWKRSPIDRNLKANKISLCFSILHITDAGSSPVAQPAFNDGNALRVFPCAFACYCSMYDVYSSVVPTRKHLPCWAGTVEESVTYIHTCRYRFFGENTYFYYQGACRIDRRAITIAANW